MEKLQMIAQLEEAAKLRAAKKGRRGMMGGMMMGMM